MTGSQMYSKFKFGSAVSIDKGAVIGCVIGFAFYSHGAQIQVSWWNSGTLIEQWVADWRLDLLEEDFEPITEDAAYYSP